MCDQHTEEDNDRRFDAGDLSRRGFGVLSMAALAACATSPADAQETVESEVQIQTPDGVCDAHFIHPARGKHPAVLVWPDILSLRPAFRIMGRRLAESGYAVLTVNPFYRSEKAPVVPEGASFSDPAIRGKVIPLMQSLTPDTQRTDANAFVQWLDRQPAVDTSKKIGTTGYCMGGPIVMRTCAYVPQRVGAGASFHGGGLATQQPTSPHLLIPQMKSSMLIAVAQNDDATDPQAKVTLRQSFDAANVPAEIEVYPAQHGWCAIDSAVFDQVQADRAWARLLHLFGTALA